METPFAKLIELAKQTGDTCIVCDEQGTPSYVIVPFDKYAKIVRIDKMAHSSHEDSDKLAENSQKNIESVPPVNQPKQYHFEPID